MPVNHVVWMKFHENVDQDRISSHLEILRALKDRVPGITDLSLGENFTNRAKGFSHCLIVTLEDKTALATYVTHPEHVAAAVPLKEDAEIMAFDYEF